MAELYDGPIVDAVGADPAFEKEGLACTPSSVHGYYGWCFDAVDKDGEPTPHFLAPERVFLAEALLVKVDCGVRRKKLQHGLSRESHEVSFISDSSIRSPG